VHRSNFAWPGGDGWSRSHDVKPTKSAQQAIDADQPASLE
jgi:hypothetical protein